MAWVILFNMTEYMYPIDQEGHNIEPFSFGAGDGNYPVVSEGIQTSKFRVVNPNEINEDSNPEAILAKQKVAQKNSGQQNRNSQDDEESLPVESDEQDSTGEEDSSAKKRTRR